MKNKGAEASQKSFFTDFSQLYDLIESFTVGVVIFDPKTKVLASNSIFQEIVKQQSSEVMLDSLFDLFKKNRIRFNAPELLKIDLKKAVLDVLKIGKPIKLDLIPLDNQIYEMTISSIQNYKRQITGGVIILEEVTNIIQIDKIKREFISVASHQLKGPLGTINWYLELLTTGEAGHLNSKQREFIKEIHQSSQKLVKMVNDLLNVSRTEGGDIVINPKLVNLPTLIRQILKENHKIAKLKDCSLKFIKPKKIPKINLDPLLFKQIFQNLISNAIDYSSGQNGKIEISVIYGSTSELKKTYPYILDIDGNQSIVAIKDNGIGIPQEDQNRIFEKFFRASNAAEANVSGSGLGLYITKMILKEINGQIWFESVKHKGSTFYFSLPQKGTGKKEAKKI